MNDLKALDRLIEEAANRENELQTRSEELALQNKAFADYLKAKQHADEEIEILWQMVKDYMVENDIREHTNDFISLKLTPSGKYKTDDLDSVPDDLCDIKRVLSNKKVKAYVELHGELPTGVASTGFILRKKLLGE